MNTRSLVPFLSLGFALSALLPSPVQAHKPLFYETGLLEEMVDVPCGSLERGVTGFGSLLATAGIEHVNAKEKLCQEYVLRTDDMEYRIRPVSEKHPVLLPVGEKSNFRIKGDHILLSAPEGDGKVREYKVVEMKPLAPVDQDSRPAAALNGGSKPTLRHRSEESESHSTSAYTAKPSSVRLGVENYATRIPPAVSPETPAALPPSSTTATNGGTEVNKASTTTSSAPVQGVTTGSAGSDPPQPAAESRQQTNTQAAVASSGNLRSGAVSRPPTSGPKPLTRIQVMGLVTGGITSDRIALLVEQRGIDFRPTATYLTYLQDAGAQKALLDALVAASQSVPAAASSAE